jgi:hypothetical protein
MPLRFGNSFCFRPQDQSDLSGRSRQGGRWLHRVGTRLNGTDRNFAARQLRRANRRMFCCLRCLRCRSGNEDGFLVFLTDAQWHSIRCALLGGQAHPTMASPGLQLELRPVWRHAPAGDDTTWKVKRIGCAEIMMEMSSGSSKPCIGHSWDLVQPCNNSWLRTEPCSAEKQALSLLVATSMHQSASCCGQNSELSTIRDSCTNLSGGNPLLRKNLMSPHV